MPQQINMRDMVIILPGITGSVLEKDGSELWAPSGGAIWRVLTSLGSNLQKLKLENDDPDIDDIGDGIQATRIMPDAHVVPGLVKIDGYSALSNMIKANFKVHPGTINGDELANFFEFPYDWRRDNRVAARQLKRLIDRRLPQWREASGAQDARVILLAHSMGGLVSRHYLEVLGGWENCKALFTFGTPYRGSINALGFLANGYKQYLLDLTEILRSCTSVYQLLPIYQMIKKVNGEYARIAEIEGIPNVDRIRAEQALAFHRAIESAVNIHIDDERYRARGYKILPVVGTKQPTYQSGEMLGQNVTIKFDAPTAVGAAMADGDGTVPYASAIPIELSHEYRDTFFAQRHSSLQADPIVLNEVRNRLRHMQISAGLENVRGPQINTSGEDEPAICLSLDDLYVAGMPATFGVQVLNHDVQDEQLTAQIEPVNGDRPAIIHRFRSEDGKSTLAVDDLAAGLYRITVSSRISGPLPVQDLFEVAPAAAAL